MPAETELEIKLAVPDHRLWTKLWSDPGLQAMQTDSERQTRQFEALYYDTADFSLQKSGIAYRIRREGEEWVATVKSDSGSGGALFSREELNEKIERPDPSIQHFTETRLGERMAAILGEQRLQLLFSTKFERTTLRLKTVNASLIELAMDHGMIWSGSSGIPISEMELELKEGCAGELLQFAGWIAEKFHLHPEPLSKYARGLSLLNIEGADWKSAEHPMRRPEPRGLLTASISGVFTAQASALREQGGAESIKALRIQIRKLRVLLKFLQPYLRREGAAPHMEKLKQWGELLGSIRDLDVLQTAWLDFSGNCKIMLDNPGDWPVVIAERRDFLATTVLYRLGRAELTRGLFELQAWLLQTVPSAEADSIPSDSHVRKSLMALVQELREEVGEIRGIPEIRRLHELRIRTKRLRYLLEAVSTVPGYRDDIMLAAMKNLQTLIGKIHDVYQIKNLLEKFRTDESGTELQSYQLQLFIGWRSRDALKNFFALPAAMEEFRKAAKGYLRTLASLRSGGRTKSGHDANPHEPVQ